MCRLTKLVIDFAKWKSVCVFSASAGMMHLGSAMTHVYPDDHFLEKLDHLGIATLVMGTPISTILVRL
jgi:predicted membrane channel-forming protein YqfA (hemolysin III family)